MFKESGHLILLVSHFHPDHLGRIEHGLPQQFFNDTDKKKDHKPNFGDTPV